MLKKMINNLFLSAIRAKNRIKNVEEIQIV